MNIKIKNYIDALFSDIELNDKNASLKADLSLKMSDKFDAYIKAGKTENQAFSLVVANLVDVNDLLDDIVIDDQNNDQAKYYLKRNARNIAFGVSLYIIGAAVLIGFGGLGDYFGLGDAYPIVGLLTLLVVAAFATGLIVYTNMSTPHTFKSYSDDSNEEYKYLNPKQGRVLRQIISIYWLIVTFVYFLVTFITKRWDFTWIIWVLAAVFEGVIKTFFEIRYGSD